MKVITNSVCLTGRVGKYKDMKYFDNGGCVCTIHLGVKRGENWNNFFIDCWNTQNRKLAEEIGENVKEGDYIQIKGRLIENKFIPKGWEEQTDENGNQKTVSQTKINAYDYKRVQFNEEFEEFEYISEA